jgi:hypothetical protein
LLRRWGRRRVALLVDEVFQAIGLDRVEVYVKSLLNIIEYPPAEYEKVIAIVVGSEGCLEINVYINMINRSIN